MDDDTPRAQAPGPHPPVDTQGGAHVRDVITGGGSFIGRDYIFSVSVSPWLAALVVLLLLALAGLAWFFILKPPGVMPKGSFNLAVADFTPSGKASQVDLKATSRQLSEWVFRSIQNLAPTRMPSPNYALRSPDELAAIKGATPEERRARAARVAADQNIDVLVYGVVAELNGQPVATLEFYVDPEIFNYASEIAGPNSLGAPVAFQPPLTPGEQSEVNRRLYTRVLALAYVIAGVQDLRHGKEPDAAIKFAEVTAMPDWPDQEGKEIAYLLEGAALQRTYDPLTQPEALQKAAAAYQKASQLNPLYPRSRLGLGSVTYELGLYYDQDKALRGVDPSALATAGDLYRQSLAGSSPADPAYTRVKANFGLGLIHLTGAEFDLPGYSYQQAQEKFEQTLAAYDAAGAPLDLRWYAADSRAMLGRTLIHLGEAQQAACDLDGAVQSYQRSTSELRRAIQTLEDLQSYSVARWLARYWAWLGYAEKALAAIQPERAAQAIQAFEKAVEIGQDVSPEEIQRWNTHIAALKQTPPATAVSTAACPPVH